MADSPPLQRRRTARDLTLRTHPLVMGTLVFLSSELMFFAALLSAYFDLRNIDSPWPPPDVHLNVTEAGVATASLIAAALTMAAAMTRLARGRYPAARAWLGLTILLAAFFVAVEVDGWQKASFAIDSNAYGSIYFLLTGAHAVHVAVLVLLLIGLWLNIKGQAFERDERAGAESLSYFMYWNLAVWLLIFGSVYLIK